MQRGPPRGAGVPDVWGIRRIERPRVARPLPRHPAPVRRGRVGHVPNAVPRGHPPVQGQVPRVGPHDAHALAARAARGRHRRARVGVGVARRVGRRHGLVPARGPRADQITNPTRGVVRRSPSERARVPIRRVRRLLRPREPVGAHR